MTPGGDMEGAQYFTKIAPKQWLSVTFALSPVGSWAENVAQV